MFDFRRLKMWSRWTSIRLRTSSLQRVNKGRRKDEKEKRGWDESGLSLR